MWDLIVVGAGPGGYEAAIRAAQLGLRVAVVERGDVGGTCLNRGCVPTKALLHAAQAYESLRHMDALGISVEGVSFDLSRIYARAGEVVQTLRDGVRQLLEKHGVKLVHGQAVVVDAHTVQVGEETHEARAILLATGSSPAKPRIPGIDLPGVLTSDDLLAAPRTMERLLIIGGGVIGVECASIFAALGVQVTIVEAMDRILPLMDREISQNLAMIFKKRGVRVFTGARVEELAQDADGMLVCTFTTKGEEMREVADTILVATGRRANTDGLFGEGFSVAMQQGRIVTDDQKRTSVPDVYAIGDVAVGAQLAHAASAQGIACAMRLAGHAPHTRCDLVPSCVYTEPEIASVGLTADEAKAQGIAVACGKYTLGGHARTFIGREERSFIKLVVDAQTDVVLGAQLMCARATDLVDSATMAIANGLTRTQMLAGMRPHPTYVEAYVDALESVDGMAIHMLPGRKPR